MCVVEKKYRKHGHTQQFINCLEDHVMPIYKIKEQIMRNLLFTFPKHILTGHLYITYHIYIDINSILKY